MTRFLSVFVPACLMILVSGCGEQPAPTDRSATTAGKHSKGAEVAEAASSDSTAAKTEPAGHSGHPGATEHADEDTTRARQRGHHRAAARTSGLKIGQPVPDFEVSIGGRTRRLTELRADRELSKDGTLVLTFWCSFCHSCRDVEMDLNALAEKYKGTVGVIAIDASAGETTEKVAEFAQSKGLTLPIALNADASAAELFGIRVTTTTVVIDADGVLRYCGQFADRDHAYAADALARVLNQEDVVVAETRHRG